MAETILRTATPAERRDFKPINEMKSWDMGTTRGESIPIPKEFKSTLVEVRQKYVQMRKPFCFRCAILDWGETYRQIVSQTKSLVRGLTKEDIASMEKITKKIGDLDKYGDESRFKLLQEKEQGKKVRISLENEVYVVENIYQYFQCNIRGCTHQIEVPLKLWEKRSGKKWLSYADEEVKEMIKEENIKPKRG